MQRRLHQNREGYWLKMCSSALRIERPQLMGVCFIASINRIAQHKRENCKKIVRENLTGEILTVEKLTESKN